MPNTKTNRYMVLSLCSLVLLSGCMHAQEAQRDPRFVVPTDWTASVASEPDLEIIEGLRGLFQDELVDQVTQQALTNNFDIRIALLRLEEAGYQTAIVGGSRLPVVHAGATGGRVGSAGDNGGTRSQYELRLDASWELDVWGRLAALRDAAEADEAAQASDVLALLESVVAQAIQRWFDLIAAEKLMAISSRKLASFSDTADLIVRRYQMGIGDFSDADAARTDQSLAEAELANRTEARRQASRELSVLSGSYPNPRLVTRAEFPTPRRSIPADLPSDVLRSRPDVEAAYQRIVAADKRMKASHRELFPAIRLTAAGGQSSSELSQLTQSGATFWSLLGGVSQPLFQGNRLRNAYEQSGVRARRAYEEYSRIALNAFAEVEQALSQSESLALEAEKRADALELAERVYEKGLKDYENGLLDVLTLLQAKRRVFELEDRLVIVQRQRLQNRVRLALALGKGV